MPRTTKHYKNITRRTRDKIEALDNAKVRVKTIAEELGYSFHTLFVPSLSRYTP